MKICAPTPALVAIILGAIFCAIAGLLQMLLPPMISDSIAKTMILSPDSMQFKGGVPSFTHFYIFNYTNHEEVLASNTTKPRVQQVGPYTYIVGPCPGGRAILNPALNPDKVIDSKVDVNFTKCADCVEYSSHPIYHFMPQLSNGTEADTVILPNVPLRTILQQKGAENFASGLLNPNEDTPFLNKTVDEFLFKGYYVAFMDETFSFFGKINDTDSPPIRVNTGKQHIKQLGNIMLFDESSVLNIWPGDSCNVITGSDGTMFAPGVSKDDKLHLFVPTICRSITADFKATGSHYGLPIYRFSNNVGTFADSNMNPELKCFCYPKLTDCLPAGLANLDGCLAKELKAHAPLVASFPHFLFAEFRLHDAIDGLQTPSFEEHGTYLDIEPSLGAVVNIKNRLQTNVLVKAVPKIPKYDALPDNLLLPLFWISQEAGAPPQLAQMINSELMSARQMETLVPSIVFGIGGGIGLLGVVCAIHLMYKIRSTSD